jgi:DNA-binding transcriptional regulator YhcF (GntR family)
MTDTKAVLRKLLSDHVGEHNAITQSQLADATGINPSTLRSELRRLREERQIPIANQRNGYYVIASEDEKRDYIAHINQEIESKKRTIEHTLEACEGFDPDEVRVAGPEPTEPCDECGTEIPEDEVMLWKSRPLCREHWEQAAQAQ